MRGLMEIEQGAVEVLVGTCYHHSTAHSELLPVCGGYANILVGPASYLPDRSASIISSHSVKLFLKKDFSKSALVCVTTHRRSPDPLLVEEAIGLNQNFMLFNRRQVFCVLLLLC